MLSDRITRLCYWRFQLLGHCLRDNKNGANCRSSRDFFRAALLLVPCFIKWKGQLEVR